MVTCTLLGVGGTDNLVTECDQMKDIQSKLSFLLNIQQLELVLLLTLRVEIATRWF